MPLAPPQHRPAWWKPREVSERERRAKTDAKRKDSPSRAWYQTPRWRTERKAFLRERPFCTECQRLGRLIPANVVDHIKPHRGDETLFWNQSNWQPMCATCHNAKTAREDGGFGNKRRS